MAIEKPSLLETSLDDDDTATFLYGVAKEDRARKHIWNISDNSRAWEDSPSFRAYLRSDFGKHCLYIAHRGETRLGVFGMLNLSDYADCANILIWIDKSVRKRLVAMKWFLQFLIVAQERQIAHWYARIKVENRASVEASERFGFVLCGEIPDHILFRNPDNEGVRCVCRGTRFNSFERKYLSRYMPEVL